MVDSTKPHGNQDTTKTSDLNEEEATIIPAKRLKCSMHMFIWPKSVTKAKFEGNRILYGLLIALQQVHPQAWLYPWNPTERKNQGIYKPENVPEDEAELEHYIEALHFGYTGRLKFIIQIIMDTDFGNIHHHPTFIAWCSDENIWFEPEFLRLRPPNMPVSLWKAL